MNVGDGVGFAEMGKLRRCGTADFLVEKRVRYVAHDLID